MCGSLTGGGSAGAASTSRVSRRSRSSVVRAIQSRARLSRLSTDRAPSSRVSRVSWAPDQPSCSIGASGTPVRPCVASRLGGKLVHDGGVSRAQGRLRSRRDLRRRTRHGESGQLRDSTTSGSAVEAFSSTWISPAGMYTKSPSRPPSPARGRSAPTCTVPGPRRCRCSSRKGRGGGCASSRPAPSSRSTSRASSSRRWPPRWRSSAPSRRSGQCRRRSPGA